MSIIGPARDPPKPPLPLPRNLPFHLALSGSQTSTRMVESDVGVSVADTRQNGCGAGSAIWNSGSMMGAPTATGMAEVIFPPVTGKFARSAQAASAVDANKSDVIAHVPARS